MNDKYIHKCDGAIKNNISIKWLGSEWFMVQQLQSGWTKNLGAVEKCPYCGMNLDNIWRIVE